MDKQEYREFLNEIKKGYDSKNYEQVAAYADEIDPGKIREPRILEIIADSYVRLNEYDKALDALEAAYNRNPSSKQIAYRLGELSVAVGDLDSAVGYYEDFCRLSENNSKALILKYEIGKAGGVPVNELIKVLEDYKSREKDERWEYELARLYHENGQEDKCIETCDDISLWFSEGEYVKKALELKFSHAALSPAQQQQYEKIMSDYLEPEEREKVMAGPEEKKDEVAEAMAEEYFAQEEQKKKAQNVKENEKPQDKLKAKVTTLAASLLKAKPETKDETMTNTARIDALQDTKVIPISEIVSEIEAEEARTQENTQEETAMPSSDAEIMEAEEEIEEAEGAEEAEEAEETEETVPAEETNAKRHTLEPSGKITFEELRAMIHEGNSKKAESGVFFTYSEPTQEDIAEEAAQKAAREEARRLAEEAAREAAAEAARRAEEEQAAKEAAAAAALEAERLAEEAKVEARLRQEEEEALKAEQEKAAEEERAKEQAQEQENNPAADNEEQVSSDREINETTFINREELLARLNEENNEEKSEESPAEEDNETEAAVETAKVLSFTQAIDAVRAQEEDPETESFGFTAMIDAFSDEMNLEDTIVPAPTNTEAGENENVGATMIFSREEIDGVLSGDDDKTELETPEEKLGAAIEQIIDDANASVAMDMEDTKSIRIVLPVASANKLGTSSVKLSQYASSVERPQLEETESARKAGNQPGAPRIIDNVDFSYIPISRDEDGQLGLNIEYLQFGEDDDVEGQMSFDDFLNILDKSISKNETKVLDVEAERLRQIQEAVNLTSPVKLPYAMDDLMFDDIEITDTDGNVEVKEGDIFQFDPKNIGIIPSDEEILAERAREAAGETETEPAEELAAPEAEIEETVEEITDEEPAEDDEKSENDNKISEIAAALVAGAAGAAVGAAAGNSIAEAAEPEEAAEAEAEAEPEEAAEAEEEAEPEEAAEAEAEAEPEEAAEAEEEAEPEETAEAEEEAEPEDAAEAEEAAEPEEESEADKAIAMFEQQAHETAESDEEDAEIEDELFDVMAELEMGADQDDASAQADEVLDSDAFEDMFGELMAESAEEAEETEMPEDEEISEEAEMSEDEEIPEDVEESDDDYAEYDNEEPGEDEYQEEMQEDEEVIITSENGYYLPDDLRNSMSEFLLIDGMEQSIVDCVSAISETKRSGDITGGNLVVTGDIKTGKTFLAIELIKAVAEELGSGNGKVAKVQADLLNGKNIEKVFEKIGGSDLIIENIGYLDDDTIEQLITVMRDGNFDSMVIIEGNQLAVESLFTTFPAFAELFKNRIDINELSIVQWAELAMEYADEKGFVLDDMAKLALHAKINEINVPTKRLGYDDVLDLVDDAIEKAEKRNSGKLFAAFKKNEDAKQEIIESDFM